ncbi:hypothetical protein BJP40_14045 [Streptomyces sp. CC53]|uniref:nitrate- and nitrite sensing domain-containing protein n=1 Tax=unclassified Streptomyces TaxID=2593676 RepID=UPI0008DD0B85|nr:MULTISPECIES: nitrate- and nitrite sensing domain-containing protein [unclassified Streptomyces]OII66236.1 hypothetical protein BJP40_14045 [Streptomyces sp. CC53]
MAGVALVGVTVVGAGAPGLLATSADLNESQGLVTFAQLNRQAVTLAHSLADERDEVTEYVAAGRGAPRDENPDDAGTEGGTSDAGAVTGTGQDQSRGAPAAAPPAAHTARVDRQIDEIRAAAPEDLRRVLAGIPELRRSALTGTGTALEVHRAYTEVIGKLQGLAAEFAHRTPARADTTGRAPAELGQATERASATRGLLLAALAVPGTDAPDRVEFDPVTGTYRTREDPAAAAAARTRDALSSAAHLTRVREQVALAEFAQEADTAARDSLTATVTGPEVTAAEKFLDALTDRPELSEKEQRTDPEKLEAALTARVEQMRGVESALAAGRVESMERLRDADVTTLELRIALLGGCLLVAIGVSTAVARSLTRPLAVLRLGAARLAASPETEEPVRFTGRNDEFAQVVRSLNALHGKVAALAARAGHADAPAAGQGAPARHDAAAPGGVPVRVDTAGSAAAPQPGAVAEEPATARQDAAAAAAREAERELLTAQLTALRAEARADTERLTAELERLRRTADETAATSVNLSLRALGLVERQLTVIEALEEREQDPERLAALFQLDHMATVMRRHCENLLILSGHEHRHAHESPVPLVDVLRAAVSEIEHYGRVAIQSLPPHTFVAGDAADDLSHLLAELLENATAFSPEGARVQLSAWLLEDGDVMLSVRDKGVGIPSDRRSLLNARLAEPSAPGDAEDDGADGGLGLRVASLLAARHDVRVELREDEQGGATALVVLPRRLLPEAGPLAAPPAVAFADGAPLLTLPGTIAEANGNTLPARSRTAATEGQPTGGDGEGQSPAVTTGPAAASPAAASPAAASPAAAGADPVAEPAPAPETGQYPHPGPEPRQDGGPQPGADPRQDGGPHGDDAPQSAADPSADSLSDPQPEPHTASAPDPQTAGEPQPHPESSEQPSGATPLDAPEAPAGPAGTRSATGHGAFREARDAHGGGEAAAFTGVPASPPAGHLAPSDAPATGDPDGAAAGHGRTARREPTGHGDHAEPAEPAEQTGHAPRTQPTGPGESSSSVADEDIPEARQTHEAHEATLQVRLPAPAEAHERAGFHPGPDGERVTGKGLPKRTPRQVDSLSPRPERTRAVDAEELRRRLGGFQRGSEDGRRAARAELTDVAEEKAPGTGDTVEEARK